MVGERERKGGGRRMDDDNLAISGMLIGRKRSCHGMDMGQSEGHMIPIIISQRRTDAPPHISLDASGINSQWLVHADISLCSSHTRGTNSCLMTAARLQLPFRHLSPFISVSPY